MKTLTESQMNWNLKKGFAWADPGNKDEWSRQDTYWTREGGYQWDVETQLWIMVF